MIRGVVNAQMEPSLVLTVFDVGDSPLVVNAAIDTGFSGFVALPSAVLTALSVFPVAGGRVQLADGSWVRAPYYYARVEWDGQVRTIQAIEIAGSPLVGMNMLLRHRLTVDVVVGGDVTIEPLP